MKKALKILFAVFLVIASFAGLVSGCSAQFNKVPEATPEVTEAVETPEVPEVSKAPVETVKPTAAPVETTQPKATEKPVEAPVETEDPAESAEPSVETPNTVENPVETQKPAETTKPAETQSPAPTQKPAETTKPDETQKPTETTKPVETHTHNWNEVTEIVHHNSITQQIWVVDQEATEGWWEECTSTVYTCYGGEEFSDLSSWKAHSESGELNSDGTWNKEWISQHSGYSAVKSTYPVYHEGSPEQGHFETNVIQEAYDEVVTIGYSCSCGATK